MRNRNTLVALISLSMGIAAMTAAGPSMAEEAAGKAEYMVACAGCHGESGKGDGPLADLLNIETPSLTTLASEKGSGTFPFGYVLWMVDGRKIIRAHGSAMPIWGERYQTSASSQRGETAEMVARGRILSLVYYLESIQE